MEETSWLQRMCEFGLEVDWGAWAAVGQAVLSALAILAAWMLQDRQHRIDVLQRSGAIVELLRQLVDVGEQADRFADASAGGTVFADLDGVLLTALREAIDAVPIHELPMAGLAEGVLRARRAMRQLDRNVDDARKRAQSNVPLTAHQAHNIRDNHLELDAAHEQAREVHTAYARRRWWLAWLGREAAGR